MPILFRAVDHWSKSSTRTVCYAGVAAFLVAWLPGRSTADLVALGTMVGTIVWTKAVMGEDIQTLRSSASKSEGKECHKIVFSLCGSTM